MPWTATPGSRLAGPTREWVASPVYPAGSYPVLPLRLLPRLSSISAGVFFYLNRDGHNENFSDNMGVEGPTDDPSILDARDRRVRAMLATLLLSQGVPMLLAGDELGNSQAGNNNAYCQDNETAWIDWESQDTALISYVASLTDLRRRFPQLRQRNFMHGDDVRWWTPAAQPAQDSDWHDPEFRCFLVQLPGLIVLFNVGDELEVSFPAHPEGREWQLEFESSGGMHQTVKIYS